jgi:5-methylcytosine-specific restriction endonuclease McrA
MPKHLPTQAEALDALTRRTLAHHKARAKAVGQILDYTEDDLRRLIEATPTCRWCRLPVGYDNLQLDHLHPTGRGGQHALHNLCVACSRCNKLRGLLTEAETEHVLEFLRDIGPAAREDLERRLLAGGKRYAAKRAAARPRPATLGAAVALEKANIEVLQAQLERSARRSSE